MVMVLPPYYTKENTKEDEKWRDEIHTLMVNDHEQT